MLLPEIKEREYRFKLALRMGLPIFALILAFVSSTLINTYESLQPSFYFLSLLLLVFSIYFIFFLIYKGFDERITEKVSKTFTREYLYKFLKTKINREYTLMLLSIDNLHSINTRYGIKNGDKVLRDVVLYISEYLKDKNINNFPMGHIKGGDFIIGLEGKKEDYNTILELLCLKSSELKIGEIEVNISGAITDTNFSNNLEYLIENLFEVQEENRNKKSIYQKEIINPTDLESFVIHAIKEECVETKTQNIYENNTLLMKEFFSKLIDENGKALHPKSYMKIVNKLGLTAEYDYLILKHILKTSINKGEELFCLSIHPTSLRNSMFLDKVKNILNDNEEVRGKIVFIITEVEYYSNCNKYNYTLQSLRKKGVKIALDKLGSFHSSFLYLRDLDIDMVRFDTFYSKDINKTSSKNMLAGLNLMAQKCGVKTWIKMLENEEINSFAQEIGINYRQGNILSAIKKEGDA